MTMGTRLAEALEWRGKTAADLIRACELSKGAVYNILKDQTQPAKVRADTSRKICDYLRVNSDWLLWGRGERERRRVRIPAVGDNLFPDLSTGSSTESTEIAHRSASEIETAAGYVRFQLLDGAGGMGAGAVNGDYPEVVRELEVAEWEVRRKLGFIPPPGRVQVLTGRGPSMRGLIEHGDVVFVDTAVSYFDGDGVYVINVGGETQIKMLQMRPDGLYVVSRNTDYPAFRVHPESDDFHIGGKVLSTLGMRSV